MTDLATPILTINPQRNPVKRAGTIASSRSGARPGRIDCRLRIQQVTHGRNYWTTLVGIVHAVDVDAEDEWCDLVAEGIVPDAIDGKYLPTDQLIALAAPWFTAARDRVHTQIAAILHDADAAPHDPAALIRQTRRRLGLNQSEFAELLNQEAPGLATNQQLVSSWERGAVTPDPAKLALIRRLADDRGV